MHEILDAAGVVLIPAAGIMGALCVAGGLSYLWEVCHGYAEPPKLRLRKKSPRKRRVLAPHVATKRGIVGQRVRRSACIYTTIVPQPTLDVKRNLPLRVEWRWMRG